ncbi:kinase subunit of RNA polymerase II carboxy-terminal domain kinase I [Microbotryomycetes sp. JL221]|nr:kinase subunit of RNA polymerase II carboxy-terminal domain kinase I [Microbotryomycetes sp. JL221]
MSFERRDRDRTPPPSPRRDDTSHRAANRHDNRPPDNTRWSQAQPRDFQRGAERQSGRDDRFGSMIAPAGPRASRAQPLSRPSQGFNERDKRDDDFRRDSRDRPAYGGPRRFTQTVDDRHQSRYDDTHAPQGRRFEADKGDNRRQGASRAPDDKFRRDDGPRSASGPRDRLRELGNEQYGRDEYNGDRFRPEPERYQQPPKSASSTSDRWASQSSRDLRATSPGREFTSTDEDRAPGHNLSAAIAATNSTGALPSGPRTARESSGAPSGPPTGPRAMRDRSYDIPTGPRSRVPVRLPARQDHRFEQHHLNDNGDRRFKQDVRSSDRVREREAWSDDRGRSRSPPLSRHPPTGPRRRDEGGRDTRHDERWPQSGSRFSTEQNRQSFADRDRYGRRNLDQPDREFDRRSPPPLRVHDGRNNSYNDFKPGRDDESGPYNRHRNGRDYSPAHSDRASHQRDLSRPLSHISQRTSPRRSPARDRIGHHDRSRERSPARDGSEVLDPSERQTNIQRLPPSETLAAPAVSVPNDLYERLVQVGEGTYGKVYKARNVETGELVALKRIRMEAEKDGFPVTAVREIKLLQSLRHPNVVNLSEIMVSRGHVYMVFEYMDHDLTGILHHPSIQLSPAHLKSLMKQFLEGLGFIHRRGVLHRDLKGSNILLSRQGELKIADFGLARFYTRWKRNDYTNRVITQWYKPPELLFGATIYDAAVDMWSAGCIFLELFERRPVFQGQDEINQLDAIFAVTGTPDSATWPEVHELPWYELVKPRTKLDSKLREMFSKHLTPGGLDVAERLLALNPSQRPTADKALLMPYFVSEDPAPEMPTILNDVKGEWHEYESKRARKKAAAESMAQVVEADKQGQ